ncbi:hypothetical protein FXF65_11495 [Actinomadura syzygii]|uniref:RNA polymerase sigma-70 region 4 domain-containing protein n=1 Tax=Actinomadura syzygii TaxID=1427538 RepID=A0A5D0UEE7_9ACTN|nr:hypothetical protein FXF65_11495 [Actinomadura syzygii]
MESGAAFHLTARRPAGLPEGRVRIAHPDGPSRRAGLIGPGGRSRPKTVRSVKESRGQRNLPVGTWRIILCASYRQGRFTPKSGALDGWETLVSTVLVVESVRALSAAHREILNETVLSGRTVNEAAEVLGIPVETVKSRVYLALRALRVALEERGVTA